MPNTKQSTRRGGIQSIDRAARILRALASGPRRLGVTELATRLELAVPTVHGLLQTLQAHGFVEQDRDSGKYQLGAGLLQLGNSYLDLNELRGRSLVHAERLAARADAAVRVGVMHGPSVIVVHHVFRPDATLQILEVGAQLPVNASALGKASVRTSGLPAGSRTSGSPPWSVTSRPACSTRPTTRSRSAESGRTMVAWRSAAEPSGGAGAPELSHVFAPRWWW